MTVKELLAKPVGTQIKDIQLIVKKRKGKTQISDSEAIRQVILTDGRDDILTDVFLKEKDEINRNEAIYVMAGLITKEADTGKKMLYVTMFDVPTINEPDEDFLGKTSEYEKMVRGKIHTLYNSAKIRSGADDKELLRFSKSETMKQLIDDAMKEK